MHNLFLLVLADSAVTPTQDLFLCLRRIGWLYSPIRSDMLTFFVNYNVLVHITRHMHYHVFADLFTNLRLIQIAITSALST